MNDIPVNIPIPPAPAPDSFPVPGTKEDPRPIEHKRG